MIRVLLLAFCGLSLLPGLVQASSADSPERLVRAWYDDRAALDAMAATGLDLRCGHGKGFVDLILPGERDMDPAVAAALGLFSRVEVLQENVLDAIPAFKGDDAGVYHTVAEAEAELKTMAAEHPDRAKLHVIGTSVEGRPIYALQVGLNPETEKQDPRPSFLICGMHHSREWIATSVPMAFAHHLVDGYDGDASVRELVDGRWIWIVPVMNPDGYHHSLTEYRMWRKNRARNANGSRGVDPNRNHAYEWGGAGASTSPGSDTYRGPSAASEPCTQAVEKLAKSRPFVGALSYHSHGQMVLWPWSYTYDAAPDDAILSRYAHGYASIVSYDPKQSSDLYPSSGDWDDFMYGECGMISFTVELATQFIPSESQVPSICAKNVKAMHWFCKEIANPFPVASHDVPPATVEAEGPYELTVELDRRHHPDVQVRKARIVYDFEGRKGNVPLEALDDEMLVGRLPGLGYGTFRYHAEIDLADGRALRLPAEGEHAFPVVETLFLLVDDDNGADCEKYYETALKALNVPYALWTVKAQGSPRLEDLTASSGVLWFCGSDSSNTLVDADQKNLETYLSRGGRLLLFGQDLAYDLKKDAFLEKVLRVAFVEDKASSRTLAGLDLLDGMRLSIDGSDGVAQKYPEVIRPLDGAFALMRYEGGKDEVGAVAWADDKGCCALFGFGLEGVDGAAERKTLAGRLVDWMKGRTLAETRAIATLRGLSDGKDRRDALQARERELADVLASRPAAELEAALGELGAEELAELAPTLRRIAARLDRDGAFQGRVRSLSLGRFLHR